MGTVTFRLEAQEAKAVNAFMRVVDAQKRTERQFGRSVKSGQRFSKGMTKATSSVRSLVGTLVGAAGLSMAVRGAAMAMRQGAETTMKFEDELTGLLSLGDNIENIKAIKASVLDMSGSFGIARENIASTMFNLQSGSANLSQTIRDELLKNTIELTKATGADLPISMNALLKTFLIYGNRLEDVNMIQNKLFKTAELGYLTFEDLAVLMPDLAAAAKTFGFTLDEISAATIVATGQLGRTEKTLTGLRNMFLRMNEVEKEGIELTGDFVENMERIGKLDPETLKKIFGVRTVAVVGAVTSKVEELAKHMETIKNVTGDIAKEKIWQRLGDQAYVFSEALKGIKQEQENISLRKDYAARFGSVNLKYELGQLAWKEGTPEAFHWMAKPMSALSLMYAPEKYQIHRQSFARRREQLIRAGRRDQSIAEEAMLEGGSVEFVKRLDIEPRAYKSKYTPEEHARMRAQIKSFAEWYEAGQTMKRAGDRIQGRAESGPMADPGA